MKNTLRHILWLLLLVLSFSTGRGASVQINVSPERGRSDIEVGSEFYISITVKDLDDMPISPSKVDGAKILYPLHMTNQASSFSNVNGKVSQSSVYTYTMTLRATGTGTYKFGPVRVGGVESNSVSYTIREKGASSSSGNNRGNTGNSSNQSAQGVGNGLDEPKFIGKGDGNLFLRAEVSHSTAYPQEALVYTVKLYTSYDAIKFIGATAAPKFDGFVVEESGDVSSALVYENYNGKSYATAVIARYIIFPQTEGKLQVKGNTYTVSVDEREYYHDPFWGEMSIPRNLQLNVTPNDLTIDVKPLPQPVPSGFSGGVGQFKITSSLPSRELLSNNAGSIIYTVSGTGNLKYLSFPDLNKIYPKEIEVFSPNTDINVSVGKSNVSGKIVYDYTFMPLEEGTFDIPSVSIIYFNPQSGKYETTTSQSYQIQVGKGSGSNKSQTKNNLTFNSKLKEIKGGIPEEVIPIVDTFGFWFIFYIIPFIVFLLIVIFYRRYLKINSDLVSLRSRKAGGVARKRLKKAFNCMKKGDKEKFYDVLLESMWGYLGDRLRIPMSELNRANVKGLLTDSGIEENVTAEVIEIIDDCEFYKYSSSDSSADMNKVYDLAVKVINDMEKSLRKDKAQNKNIKAI